MENLRFKGKNKDFKEYLDKAIKNLNDKEKRICSSGNEQIQNINTTTILYRRFLI